MTVSQKAALSLLISVFLFAGFAVLAYTGIFDLIETRTYTPSLIKSLTRETNKDTEIIQDFLDNLQSRFSASLNEGSVRHSFLPNQSAEDIFERTRIYGMLLESVAGLQSVRFVDLNGIRLHFSTYSQDIISQDRLSVSYRNYNEDPQNLPFDRVEASVRDGMRLIFQDTSDRIIFSFPFFDSLDIFRGTALFTVSVRAVAERLVSENRIKIGEDVSVTAEPLGIITGSPGTSKNEILSQIISIWNDGLLTPTPFESEGGSALAIISAKTEQGIYYGRIVNKEIFSFPQPMKVILLTSIFLTIYLAAFLLFNLKQDNMTIIQDRLKKLQISLIENYYEHKGDMDWDNWTMELEQRRDDVRAEVKRGLRYGQGRRAEENIDTLIDKSWDELLAVIGGRRKVEASFDEEKLQGILNRVLQAIPQGRAGEAVHTDAAVQASPAVRTLASASPNVEPAEALEVLDDIEPVEAVEELEDIESADDLVEMEDIEPVQAVEELENVEPAEDIEPVEAMEKPEDDKSNLHGLLALAEGMTHPGLLALAEKKHPGQSEQSRPSDMKLDIGGEEIIMTDSKKTDGQNLEVPDDLEDFGEFEELEELEELEEISDIEDVNAVTELDEPDSDMAASAPPDVSMQTELDMLASKIEFSTDIFSNIEELEASLDADLEIVSPFASMLSSLGNKEDNLTEEDKGIPALQNSTEIQEGDEKPPEEINSDGEVILEKNGINIINNGVLSPDEKTEENLDVEFKDLVDSVIHPGTKQS